MKNTNWISVKNELPKDSEKILVFTSTGHQCVCIFYPSTKPDIDPYYFCSQEMYASLMSVTHWRPLPEAPE